MRETDLTRVVCALHEIADGGARGFTIGEGDWPLRGLVIRDGAQVRGFINRCPHAGHPLNLQPHRFLSADGAVIVCASHGALFEKSTGFCLAGPCSGRSLERVPLRIEAGYVILAEGYTPSLAPDGEIAAPDSAI
jgi:nitrite reductase/ring-hydroxylating ferredoxin subunit